MSHSKLSTSVFFSCVLILVVLPALCHAFGAGNIGSTAKIEGTNWRHGDIEDTLLTLLISRAAGGKKFSKMDVKRVYFGNWLRDYSQAVDVGTVKSVSAEAIRIILWVLGFLTFGYGTKEFEVTRDRLGCYRPEEHIDNPKDYADNIDARQYDRRLRGPVDEHRELGIDPRTGLKNYIASEDMGIMTSATLVRDLFGRSIHLGRQFARTRNNDDLYEALRLLGTGCHCLEDYSAHSNYTELSLIEMGERDVFPHVGRNAQLQIQGARNRVYPIVTGTFGGVDFLHSVMGEFSDKATQSEIQELEGTISQSESQGNASLIKDLLDKLPSGLIGGNQAGKADELQANSNAAKMSNMRISPREPEAWTQQLNEMSKQIYPILEFHDDILKSINEAIEKIPVLPTLIEQLQDQINMFVFSLLAPFVLPVIRQVKTELSTGSGEIIQSSREKQLNTFRNDFEDNPTHSMLSKDHFSNILNEPAGKIASQVLKWAVPQLIACWDDERIDANRTVSRIITGVFHHPALREYGDDGARDCRQLMFGIVERWWREKDERERDGLRQQLSRDGVENGRNHKEGVQDSGHGCCKPLGMATVAKSGSGGPASALLGNVLGGSGSHGSEQSGGMHELGSMASQSVGGGALGGIVGGLVGGVGASLLGESFSKKEESSYASEGYETSGAHSSSTMATGHHHGGRDEADRYGQAEYKQTSYPDGGREEYNRYEQEGQSGQLGGYGYSQSTETRPTYGGGHQQTTEYRDERPGGGFESRVEHERFDSMGQHQSHREDHYRRSGSDDDSDDDSDYEKKERKAREKREAEERERRGHYGNDDQDDYARENQLRERAQGQQGGYERREEAYGNQGRGEYEGASRREEYGDANQGRSGYGGYEPGARREGYGSSNQRELDYGEQAGGYERGYQREYEEEREGYQREGTTYGGGRQAYEERDSREGGLEEFIEERIPGGFGGEGGYEERRDEYGGYERRDEY